MNSRIEIDDNKLRHVPRGVLIRPHIKVVIIVKENKSLHSPRTRTIILHTIYHKYTHEAYLLFYQSMLQPKPKTNHSWNEAMTG